MGDCERERLITVLKLKTWWGGGEGLPRVEGCSMGALSNLRFFLCRMVGFVLVIVSLL